MSENKEMTLIYRGGCRLENLGSADKTRKPDFQFADIAVTLMARDYKGLNNYGSNGVIEIWKLKK